MTSTSSAIPMPPSPDMFNQGSQSLTAGMVPYSALQPPKQAQQPAAAQQQNPIASAFQNYVNQQKQQDAIKQKILQDPGAQQAINTAFAPESPMPVVPVQEYKSSLNAFKDLLPALAILGGSFTKTPLMAATKAATGAMEGFNKGQQDQAEQKMREFKEALGEWKYKHDQVREMQDQIVDKSGNVNTAALAAYASAHGNHGLLAALQTDHQQAYKMYVDYETKAAELDKVHAETSKDLAAADRYKNVTNGLVVGGVEKQVFDKWYTDKMAATGEAPSADEMQDKLAEIRSINAERTSEARTVGGREGAIKVASEAVGGAVKLAVDASNKVDRSQFPTINAAIEAAEKGTGDQNVVDFVVKNNTLINEYAAAQNPRGYPRVSDKDHARDLLDLAYSKGQYQTAANAILAEIKNIKGAVNDVEGQYSKGEKTQTTSDGWSIEKVQ